MMRVRLGSDAMTRIAAATIAVTALVTASCDLGTPSTAQPPPSHACFTIQDPYAVPGGLWHRSNFHMHTSHSDGALDAEQTIDLYARNGYTALCISDHNQYGDQDGGVLSQFQTDESVHDWNGDGTLHPEHVFGSGVEAYVRDYTKPRPVWMRDAWSRPELLGWDGPTVLAGAEMSQQGWHFGVVGLPGGALEPPNSNFRAYVGRTHANGGFAFLAHPSEWNPYPDRLAATLDVHLLDGIEIMNGLRLTRWQRTKAGDAAGHVTGWRQPSVAELLASGTHDCAGNDFPPDATPLWDALLVRGYRLWGLANDDSHKWPGADEAYPFTAFDMVLTAEATPEGFLEALHAGAFYASNGLFFQDIGVLDGSIVVSAPDAKHLRFIGWGGRVLAETEATHATYTPTGNEGYVRVEASGTAAAGKGWVRQAWSQPFYLEATACAAANTSLGLE